MRFNVYFLFNIFYLVFVDFGCYVVYGCYIEVYVYVVDFRMFSFCGKFDKYFICCVCV